MEERSGPATSSIFCVAGTKAGARGLRPRYGRDQSRERVKEYSHKKLTRGGLTLRGSASMKKMMLENDKSERFVDDVSFLDESHRFFEGKNNEKVTEG